MKRRQVVSEISDTLSLLMSVEYSRKNTHHLLNARAFENDT